MKRGEGPRALWIQEMLPGAWVGKFVLLASTFTHQAGLSWADLACSLDQVPPLANKER